ncbi:MAG: glutamate synthase subunit beta [bacterium]
MGNPTGFLKVKRETMSYRPVCDRVKDFKPVAVPRTDEKAKEQASRCMDCGTDFCNWACPLGNYVPEWNDHAYRDRWEGAYILLSATNVLPEVTGRVCPAPCESACVLGINDYPVTIRENELAIIEKAFKEGYVKPERGILRTGKKVAVIGSGPAGLSTAAFLNMAGHTVTVFEKEDRLGGFMRYGIPDFKLEKSILDRRLSVWQEEGIRFKTCINVGINFATEELIKEYDAVCVAVGCRVPRDMNIPGRQLKGIYQAVDYLTQSNRKVAGDKIEAEIIDAKGKSVLVIGGGDTGADCVGTANRQGAKCVMQIEILPEPSRDRPIDQPWPKYPFVFKTTSSHEEGSDRKWNVTTKEFAGENGIIKKVKCAKVEWVKTESSSRPSMKEVEGSAFDIDVDLVIFSMGFTNPVKEGLLEKLAVKLDERGNIIRDAKSLETTVKGVFAAGDVSRGPSLIVWAIAEGRKVADGITEYLASKSK